MVIVWVESMGKQGWEKAVQEELPARRVPLGGWDVKGWKNRESVQKELYFYELMKKTDPVWTEVKDI